MLHYMKHTFATSTDFFKYIIDSLLYQLQNMLTFHSPQTKDQHIFFIIQLLELYASVLRGLILMHFKFFTN